MTKNRRFRVSKVINAPLDYVYRWCTDFREDDNKIWGSTVKRIVLQKTRDRVVYMSTHKHREKSLSVVRIVTLKPPKSWHLDLVGQEKEEIGNYRLTKLGTRKTRLNVRFDVKHKVSHPPTKRQETTFTSKVWDKYVSALERDYNTGR